MRSRDVIGKPVVSADGGQKIGAVSDLLLDYSHTHLAGLVIGNGWFTIEHVLLYENVQTIGPDAVLARTRDGIVDAGEWKKRGLQHRASSPKPTIRSRPSTARRSDTDNTSKSHANTVTWSS